MLRQKLHEHTQTSFTTLEIETAICQIQELEPRPARNFGHSEASIVTPDLKAEPQALGRWQVSLTYEVEQRFCLNSEAMELLQNK